MKKLIALIMLAFIGYQCINSMHPSKKRAAESQEESNKRARIATVTLLTSDDHEIIVNKSLAEKSSYITGMLQSLGDSDESIPLPDIDREGLLPIIAMLTELNNADQAFIKPHGQRYIPQRIQPIINQAVGASTFTQRVDIIQATEFLDLGYLTNGLIRILVQKALADFPTATIETIQTIQTIQGSHGSISVHLRPLIEYQYHLVKNGNIPELSIADYIAINGMPQIIDNALNLEDKNLTSIEGLLQINGIETAQKINLSANAIVQLPVNVFRGLTNLRRLALSNNPLTQLPSNLFQGLTNLQDLNLRSSQLTQLPANLFQGLTNLQYLWLNSNQLTQLPSNLFQGLPNLRWLYLDHNQLIQLPANIFQGLPNLTILDLDTSRLTQLPADIFQGLTNLADLDLRNNPLTQLPSNLFQGLTNLEKLNLSYNPLTQLPSNLFQGLTNLADLDLSYNQLTQLPSNLFQGLTNLRHISLYGNQFTDEEKRNIETNLAGIMLFFDGTY